MKCKLPESVYINKEIVDDLDEIADILSDEYGFCIKSLQMEEEDGMIFVHNIQWDESD